MCVCVFGDTIGLFNCKKKTKHKHVFVLRDVNAESKLFASSDVEAQAVVVRGGEEMDDPAEGVVRAGL